MRPAALGAGVPAKIPATKRSFSFARVPPELGAPEAFSLDAPPVRLIRTKRSSELYFSPQVYGAPPPFKISISLTNRSHSANGRVAFLCLSSLFQHSAANIRFPMKHINFTDLRVFLAIADTGNLTRAAAQCCITPSAASVRLKHLEAEAGCELVTRLPRGLALTLAGERLLRKLGKSFGRSPA